MWSPACGVRVQDLLCHLPPWYLFWGSPCFARHLCHLTPVTRWLIMKLGARIPTCLPLLWPLLHCCSLKKTLDIRVVPLLFNLEWILGLLLLYFPLRVQFRIVRSEQVQFHPGSTTQSTNNWALLCYVLSHISQCPVLSNLLCASRGARSHNHVLQ